MIKKPRGSRKQTRAQSYARDREERRGGLYMTPRDLPQPSYCHY